MNQSLNVETMTPYLLISAYFTMVAVHNGFRFLVLIVLSFSDLMNFHRLWSLIFSIQVRAYTEGGTVVIE